MVTENVGERFVRALAVRDYVTMTALLQDGIDFRAMTPGRIWEATEPSDVVQSIIRSWFQDGDEILELLSIKTHRVCDREHVSYRFAVRRPDGLYQIEQQAYYDVTDGAISYMRVLCSGYRSS